MDKLLLKPEEAAEVIGVGHSKIFELIRVGALESVRIGACRRIRLRLYGRTSRRFVRKHVRTWREPWGRQRLSARRR